ncbi:cyclophilin type peptidyl-prolyl cis-trans isomerase/CLD [Colletotrichum graminicola]|nr:cyclophilin type peptidyl-prolyl cis-trans isomerase/CLD [Colletotrichum graminicola]
MPRPKKPGAPEPKRRSRNGCWPCKARKVKCGEEHPTCINCQKTGEACDYSVRLNWEGRRTKRSLSFGIATETAQSPKAPVQFQPSSFSHTFPISNSVPQIRPKPTIRRSQTAPQGVEPGKRKLEPLGALEDYPNKADPGSFHAIPRRQTQTLAPSPMSAQHTVDSFTSMPSSHQTVPEDTGKPLIAHKRTRSLAESSDSGVPRQHSYISSPASLTGSSPPVSRLRSRTGSTSVGSPLTPVSLVLRSEDGTRSPILSLPSPVSPGSSRLSVNYLLSGSPRTPHGRSTSFSLSSGTPLGSETTDGGADEADEAVFYGYDHGIRDTDINHNDDFRAISQTTTYVPHDSAFPSGVHNKAPWRFELAQATSVGDGYYSQPVPIWIPHNLQPLPPK